MMDDLTKKEISRVEALKEAYEKIFNSEEGKKVLEDLEKNCFVKTTTFPFNQPSALLLAFNEGKRAVILHIRTMLEWDIEKLKRFLEQEGGE